MEEETELIEVTIESMRNLTGCDKTMAKNQRVEWLERAREQDRKEVKAECNKIKNFKYNQNKEHVKRRREMSTKRNKKKREEKRSGLKCIICKKGLSKLTHVRVTCRNKACRNARKRDLEKKRTLQKRVGMVCVVCKKDISKMITFKKTCGSVECTKIRNKQKYKKLVESRRVEKNV